MKPEKQQDQSNLKWVADFIWNIADDRLRDVYVRGKYRDVILPFTVLRRLDAVLESTKQAVLERKRFLDTHKVAEQDGALRMAAGQAFYNTSDFTLDKLKASSAGQRLRDDFSDYLDGFSPNVQEILDLGLHAFAMSRFSGVWAGMKTIQEIVESSATVQVDPNRVARRVRRARRASR